MLKIQLDSADSSLEHTEFRVDFEAIRKDTMQSSGKVMGVTLRYNTPPVAPTPVVRNEAGDGRSVFGLHVGYGSASVAAVDSEGVSSSLLSSGQTVPPATYVIKYDGNGADGGTAPTSQSKTQYTDITLATNSGGLTRIGYRFTGWNTDPDGAGTTYSPGAAYSADEGVILYAQWEAVDAVTFSRDGAVNSGDTVELTPPKAEVTIYYSTDGGKNWDQGQQNQSVTINLYNEKSMPQSQTGVDVGIPEGDSVTITAYAKYADGTQSKETTGTYTLKHYAVSYNGNNHTGGTEPSQQTFYSGDSVTVHDKGSLTKTGYTFTEWQGDGGTSYSQGTDYGENKDSTLTAQWKANTYTVKFEGNGSDSGSMDPQQFTYDQLQQLAARQFTRTNYEFSGWNTQANGGGTSYTDVERVSNLTDIDDGTVTLYAQWKLAMITLDASKISSADVLRTELANYNGCTITVDLGGKRLEVTNSDLATNTEFFTVKDGNKVTIINGTVAVTGDFSTSSTSDKFLLFSVKTGSTLNLSGCTLTGTNFWNAGGTAVEVSDGGSLTLANTTISNFESNSTGAGVYVSGGGSAIMNSGAIKNNKARYGAAVYLAGSFTMNGGEISGNTNINGSTISRSGTFEWNGGTISNNTNGTADGGSVFASGINYGGTKSKNDAS